jgi:hypothetical protein
VSGTKLGYLHALVPYDDTQLLAIRRTGMYLTTYEVEAPYLYDDNEKYDMHEQGYYLNWRMLQEGYDPAKACAFWHEWREQPGTSLIYKRQEGTSRDAMSCVFALLDGSECVPIERLPADLVRSFRITIDKNKVIPWVPNAHVMHKARVDGVLYPF